MTDNRCISADTMISSILEKIPRPNYSEFPQLYEELDNETKEIGRILICSKFFDSYFKLIRFDMMSEIDFANLIKENPEVMVPFFVMICGFSERELERLYGIKGVYSLRKSINNKNDELLKRFSLAIKEHLRYTLSLETVLYKFYKNWEEHQKRHQRAQRVEKSVIDILTKEGYNAKKVSIECKGKRREIDCAILPPDTQGENVLVAIQVRTGVTRDLVKRAKEYSTEFDEIMECYPKAKFVVLYLVSPHEKDKKTEIRKKIEDERKGKRPYDLVLLELEDVRSLLLKMLEEWGIPKR